MGETTTIPWCRHTFNPWIGCTKISRACDNCYAQADFELRKHRVIWGAGHPRSRTSKANWALPKRWDKKAAADQAAWTIGLAAHHGDEAMALSAGYAKPTPPKVFCASLADVFDNEVPTEWRIDLFQLIEATPHLEWLLLTKRVGNVRSMVPPSWLLPGGWPTHVRLGATICDQTEADRDIPKLLKFDCPNFLSIEPLLGPIDLSKFLPELDWVIVGGESKSQARPMHPDWPRSLREQCQAANVPFMFKQWGEWRPMQLHEVPARGIPCHLVSNGSKPAIASGSFQMSHQIKSMITDPVCAWQYPVVKIGTNKSGRLLDGITHDGVPG